MLGYPKYQKDDKVLIKSFKNNKYVEGTIYIVDAFGTLGQNEEVSYDIYVLEENMLYKHIRESEVKALRK